MRHVARSKRSGAQGVASRNEGFGSVEESDDCRGVGAELSAVIQLLVTDRAGGASRGERKSKKAKDFAKQGQQQQGASSA